MGVHGPLNISKVGSGAMDVTCCYGFGKVLKIGSHSFAFPGLVDTPTESAVLQANVLMSSSYARSSSNYV
jgi:hypothetical protein